MCLKFSECLNVLYWLCPLLEKHEIINKLADPEFIEQKFADPVKKAWEILSLGSESLLGSPELLAAIAIVASSPISLKYVLISLLSCYDKSYGKAWSWYQQRLGLDLVAKELERHADFDRASTMGAFLGVLIDSGRISSAFHTLQYFLSSGLRMHLNYLTTERLSYLLARLLRKLDYQKAWTDVLVLSDDCDFGQRVVDLGNYRASLFYETMDRLRVRKMPLGLSIFSTIDPQGVKD